MNRRRAYTIAALSIVIGCRQSNMTDDGVPNTVTQSVAPAVVDSANNTIHFHDQTEMTHVDFRFQNGEANSDFSILESLGGGVAIFDFDGDGRLDVLLPGGGSFEHVVPSGLPSALYRNLGNWKFVDSTDTSKIGPSRHFSHGAIVADIDEDGFDDALITGYGGVTMYRNQGDGSFLDITNKAMLHDTLWSSSAAWGDFNGDAYLDLYIAHYVDWSVANNPHCLGSAEQLRDVCPPRTFEGLPDSVYFGNGDGTFRDATLETGVKPIGKGLGVVAADLDLDGDLEIYVTNDTEANLLLRNDGNGRFEDKSHLSGTAGSDRGTPEGSMGVDVGDYNMDGMPDIWVANYERENFSLYRNQGNLLFRHVSQSMGIAAVGGMYVGWGTRFLDADLDGDEDLIVANGHVIRFPQHAPRLQKPLMLENIDGTRFVNICKTSGEYLNHDHAGRGLATGDLDEDGDEDVVISNLNEQAAILSNEASPERNWLTVRIIGRSSCRSAIGGFAVASVGDRTMMRQIRGGSSFASTSDLRLHFGLGTASRVEKLDVRWISGRKVALNDLACNQVLTIIEP